ncbi:thioredoxin family protein [Neptunomonas japonica]|uniref:Thioredoxin family protein n=1 Tax=Neptunomonas japonica JAMM 1380 TaxID=1441457 RepID=A0A7R6PRB7_9GAMM|nr:thioredoxin family protein [Neptunomonas japonica]BBB31197.1 conserved hypothetical protein [Neptunomonas japonica JAMM 1380]
MKSYKALFELGDNFHTYVGRGTPQERQAVAKISALLEVPQTLPQATLDALSEVTERYYLLVAGEMWCPDCQINITALNKMCELQPKIQMAVISKGRAEDEIMESLGLDKILIPVVAILDRSFQVVGRFVEKPVSVSNPEERIQQAYSEGEYLSETLCEVLEQIK